MALPNFSSLAKSVTNFVSTTVPKSSSTVFDLLDPANARRAISGLLPGGLSGIEKAIPNIGFASATASGAASAAGEDDWRVRISLADSATVLYKDPAATTNSIMSPLIETNGVIWPYTPSITVTHTASYNNTPLTHSNYSAHFYNNSDVSDINITGDFTVQSQEEGQYLMAVVYFLRSATKMFFGQGANAGNPPPIVFLNGYGSHYFPNVPCVITNFTHVLKEDVDYIQIPVAQSIVDSPQQYGAVQNAENVPSLLVSSTQATTEATKKIVADAARRQTNQFTSTITSTTRLPTNSQIQVSLRPIYSRANLHKNFNLNDFAQGKLIGGKGRGGFI